MAFLTIDELKTEAPASFINILVGVEDDAVNEIILDMMDLIRTNLGAYYDMDAVFNAIGDARSRTIVNYLKDLVYYKLQKRRKPGVLDNSDYEEAMRWIEEVSAGKRKADLPKKMIDIDGDGIPDQEVPFMKLGGRKTYKNHW
jgi:hypothetical protein